MATDGADPLALPAPEPPARHPLNAPGPFYVEKGCCTACDVPRLTAPDLFKYDDDQHCYVCRQPASADEMSQMVRTFVEQEFGCIRYGGSDPAIVQRIAENGDADFCDSPRQDHFGFVARPLVSFVAGEAGTTGWTSTSLASDFASWLRGTETQWLRFQVLGPTPDADATELKFAWVEGNFHGLRFSSARGASGAWLVRYVNRSSDYVPNARIFVHDWLVARGHANAIRWFSETEWAKGEPGRATPW